MAPARRAGRAEPAQSAVELLAALSLMAIVAAAAWEWLGTVTRRDLVLPPGVGPAAGAAGSRGHCGIGPALQGVPEAGWVRRLPDGLWGRPLNVSASGYTAQPGPQVKSVRVGRELASGLQIIPPGPGGTVGCTAQPGIPAVAFGASGAPVFQDGAPHAIMVALRGRSLSVAIAPHRRGPGGAMTGGWH